MSSSTTTIGSRKRSRSQQKRLSRGTTTKRIPLPLLLVAGFLSISSIAPSSLVVDALTSHSALRSVPESAVAETEEDEWYEECDGPDCYDKVLELQEDCDEDDCNYEYFYEEGDEEEYNDWTPSQIEEMEALYERYCASLAEKFGPDWEDDYELVEDMEVIYTRYLDFQEEKRIRKEEQEKIQASHQALRSHNKNERIQESDSDLWLNEGPDSSIAKFIIEYDSMYLQVGDMSQTGSYTKNGTESEESYEPEKEPSPATIVTIRDGSTQNVVGFI